MNLFYSIEWCIPKHTQILRRAVHLDTIQADEMVRSHRAVVASIVLIRLHQTALLPVRPEYVGSVHGDAESVRRRSHAEFYHDGAVLARQRAALDFVGARIAPVEVVFCGWAWFKQQSG